jgi:hypothetical protein
MDRAAAREAAAWSAFRAVAVPPPPPPPVDAFAVLGFTPNPGPQTRFLDLPDANLDVLYGGAAGGSKSTSLLMYALRACSRFPGLQAFWFRRSFPELQQSVLRMLARYGFGKALHARWNASRHELIFTNGSVLTFGHAKNMVEASALLSAEINLLLIDERTTIPPDVVGMLYSRVRSGVAGVPCLGIRSATNPGGIGHSRVKAEFVVATNYGEHEIDEDASGRRRIFIQAKVSDTPQLGAEYRRGLQGLGDEKLIAAYLDGDWEVFAGQVFAEWRYEKHTVKPWTLPVEWRRARGIDYGFAAPFAVVWAAVDNDGRLWFYRDLSRTQVIDENQAKMITAAEAGEHITWTPADPSMWAKKGENAKSPADVYAENGVHITPAHNDRIIGWRRIHSYLANGPACEIHRAEGLTECPMVHVFTTCAEIIKTLPALPHATKGNPEDADTASDDHIPDAFRYLVMDIGGGPQFVPLDDIPEKPSEDLPAMQAFGQFAIPAAVDDYSSGGGWFGPDEEDGPRPGGVVIRP